MQAQDYPIGAEVLVITYNGKEYRAKVSQHTALNCCLVLTWIPPRPGFQDINTVCLYHVREIRLQ